MRALGAHRELRQKGEHTGTRKRARVRRHRAEAIIDRRPGNDGYDSNCGHHNLHNSCAWQKSFIRTGIKRARVQKHSAEARGQVR
jgi:hypothetical protein